MTQRDLVQKALTSLVMISLTIGCRFTTPLAAAPDPNQDTARAAIQDSQSGSMEGINRAEQDITDDLREQSGARAAFGSEAEAIFQQIDQAKAAAVDDLVKRSQGQGGNEPEMPAGLALVGFRNSIGGPPGETGDFQLERMAGTLGMMLGTSLVLEGARRDENGNAISPKLETDVRRGAASIHTTFEPTMMGSRMDGRVEMVARITEPVAYEEHTTGKVSMEICPDGQGDVPLELSFRSSVSVGGGGQQLGADVQATGHVGDEGKLTNFEMQSTGSGAVQPIAALGDKWSTTNQYAEFRSDMSFSMARPDDLALDMALSRQSSQLDQEFANKTAMLITALQTSFTVVAFVLAEMQWTNGYCMEVQVPELGESRQKSVEAGSQTPFEAVVRHKFEKVELNVPVIATLKDGQESVSPSGNKVPAPAPFVYKAPDKSRQSATVALETRSKRGIAKLDITFVVGKPGWKLRGWNYSGNGVEMTGGLSCDSPYGPWNLKVVATVAGGTTTSSDSIPFSEDGNSRTTHEEHMRGASTTEDALGVSDVHITPTSEGYQMTIGSMRITAKYCALGVCGTKSYMKDGLVFEIIPAAPGECSKP